MGYYSSMIWLIPAVILTFYAQSKVKSAYSRYSGIANSKGASGMDVARLILTNQGMGDMPINLISGQLSDNYNPSRKTLNLSEGVYAGRSIAAIGIAAHECGHACQDHEGSFLLRFRNSIVPVTNIASGLAWPLFVLGLIIGSVGLYNLGILLFVVVVLFHLVTLPMELDASRRGLKMLQEYGVVTTQQDYSGAKAVLDAAALTYVAALAMSVANLLRMMALSGGRRR